MILRPSGCLFAPGQPGITAPLVNLLGSAHPVLCSGGIDRAAKIQYCSIYGIPAASWRHAGWRYAPVCTGRNGTAKRAFRCALSGATPARERKRIARLLLTDVTVTRTRDTITAHIRLPAGQHHTLTLPIPPTAAQLRKTPAAVITAIDEPLDPTPVPRSPASSTTAA
jgi:hypothetical protein